MTKEELAAQLNGLEYPTRIPGALIVAAQSAGLVILCGASDDLMEFYGARREEIGCYDGGTAFVDADGVLPDRDCLDGDEELAEYVQRQKSAKSIEALWCKEDGYSWTYKTEIPHATFEVADGDEPYCRGIVFSLTGL
ncbi:MAG: hypothetical protein ACN6NZ_02895 [Burkholderiales bacterium]|jgi:hypothetical protein|uniref:hypothetical protein n=1 Tax=Pseudomonas kermanshahensis TaxID=2745482 RepID=UPI0020920DDA|nr:hypothetical protein [Pseudomonas kermanshahensis]USS54211.1 hypothetical protein NG836_20690 [Pseudomonas kermanshahensis]